MISSIWILLILSSLIFGLLTGQISEVTGAVAQGAAGAVTLWISLAGIMCFWSGLMELVLQSGLSEKIARSLHPILKLILGCRVSADPEAMNKAGANITANLLGISNAATPIGLQAAKRIYVLCGGKGTPKEVLRWIILNTTSIQLIPSTVAAVRSSLGAAHPFDIMSAVWGASFLSVAAALLAAKALEKLRKWELDEISFTSNSIP